MMKLFKILALVAVLGSAGLTLTSCREGDNDNAVEQSADQVEDAADKAGDSVEDAADKATDATSNAVDSAGDAAEDAAE